MGLLIPFLHLGQKRWRFNPTNYNKMDILSKIYKECDGYSFGILVVGVQVREALYCYIYVP